MASQGFRNALEIAYQNRPRLFDRHIQRPERLYHSVMEANERLSHNGDIVTKLDTQQLTRDVQRAHRVNAMATLWVNFKAAASLAGR